MLVPIDMVGRSSFISRLFMYLSYFLGDFIVGWIGFSICRQEDAYELGRLSSSLEST